MRIIVDGSLEPRHTQRASRLRVLHLPGIERGNVILAPARLACKRVLQCAMYERCFILTGFTGSANVRAELPRHREAVGPLRLPGDEPDSGASAFGGLLTADDWRGLTRVTRPGSVDS